LAAISQADASGRDRNFSAAACQPPCAVSWMLGKNAARADSTLAFAAARFASASRMSGRRVSSSEGSPVEIRGMATLKLLPPWTSAETHP